MDFIRICICCVLDNGYKTVSLSIGINIACDAILTYNVENQILRCGGSCINHRLIGMNYYTTAQNMIDWDARIGAKRYVMGWVII